MPNANLVASKIAPQERWLKLYRKIHNLFLSKEFVHIVDYNLMVQQMNARITAIESSFNAQMAAMQAATNASILAHTHPVQVSPVSGTGATVGSINAAPVPPPVPSAAPLVQPVTTAMEAYDASLMAMGPGLAPMGEGLSVEAITASTTAQLEVGI